MQSKTLEENVKNIINSIEEYKNKSGYKEKQTDLLKMEVKTQQSVVENLFEMARIASSTDISYSERMVREQDKLRELQNKLSKIKKVEKELNAKLEGFENYLSDLKKQKIVIKNKINRDTKKIAEYTEKINELKAKENKTPEELEKLNELLEKRGRKEESRKETREKLGEINKALKVGKEYKENGIIPKKEDKEKGNSGRGDDDGNGNGNGKGGRGDDDGNGNGDGKSGRGDDDGNGNGDGKSGRGDDDGNGNSNGKGGRGDDDGNGNGKGGRGDDDRNGNGKGGRGDDDGNGNGKGGRGDGANTYGKTLEEYKMSLEMYNQDLETLYNLQSEYENGKIEYSEYEKHADYMVERYRFMQEEYKKIKGQYESEKNKTIYSKQNETEQWHPDLTQEQIDYIKSELEIYKPVGDEYEQALRQLGLDPSKQPIIEQNETEQWHPDLTAEQIEYIKSELEIYKPVGDEYEQALRQLGIDPNKKINKSEIDLEAPEKPVQPMMILEKDKDIPQPTIDYDAIEEEYAYRKQDMVDKFMGNREKAKEYEERLNRFKDHIVEKEFEYVDENGKICKGIYKTVEGYEEYERDTFFLQLEEYKDRLEDMTKFDAGDKSIYKDIKIGDRIITAQEQRDSDNEYVKTYNNAYNSHVHTQQNLMTLGNYGDKLPYSKFEKKQPIRNIFRGAVNVLKFARNWTIAPVSRFVGKRIVAPIHKAIYKPDQSNPNPYKGRLTHRYEQRKNYFREQGKGYFRSSFAAMFKYKEGNRGTLAARGGEIYQSIENKHVQRAQKEVEVQAITNRIQNIKEKIDRVKDELQHTNDEKEKSKLNKELTELIETQTNLQKERYEVLNKKVSQTIQTDSIDKKTHDRANKRTITRAVTTVKALAIGATRYFGPKLHKRIIEGTREEVVTWKKGPDTVVNSKQYVEGNYEDLTIGDYMEGEATGTYAVDGMTPHHAGMTPKAARGFAYRDGSAGDGYTSFIDGNGMTAAEVARYADKRVPADLLDAAGNLDSTTKMVNLAKEVGVQINSKADYDNFINNIELCLSESSRKIPSGWVGNLSKRLGRQITDGHWETIATTVPGKMQKVIEYADNETVKNILDMIRKGTDKVIIADVIDQVYQNVRETEGKGKKFGPNRDYGFDDKGKTKGPEGFDYDRKGRNKNTGKSFVPTYSSVTMNVLGAKSLEELKEKLSDVKISDLTEEEKAAISARMEELNKEKKLTNDNKQKVTEQKGNEK